MSEHTVKDDRSAELNADGRTAGRHMNTLENLLDDDGEYSGAPDAVWVCDHCDHTTETADSMLDHLQTEHEPSAERNKPKLDRLAHLISETTAARGVDVYAVETCGMPASTWARMTNRDRSTVSRNVRRASAKKDTEGNTDR